LMQSAMRGQTRVPTAARRARSTRVLAPRAVSAPSADSPAWNPATWKDKTALQMPAYPDEDKLESVVDELSTKPPLVFAGEARELQAELGRVAMGQGFLLQGGDCAEAFSEANANHIRDTFRVLVQMSLIMQFGSGIPITKIGRMAGQYAKPRSEPDEVRDGVALPSYRGDIINGEEFTPESRIPDPTRFLTAYNQSAQTLNLLRALSAGGYASISRIHDFTLEFVRTSPEGEKYEELAERVSEAMRFVNACGIPLNDQRFTQTKFYTAHECLLLPYEQALTRQDSTTGLWYDTSAHLLWLGERTRQLDGAHVEFAKGINNPLGVKVSNKASVDEVIGLCEALNPENIPGRLTLVCRMGADNLYEHYPKMVRAVSKEGYNVVWQSDPMHGNTFKAQTGYKTRAVNSIRAELRAFFDVHEAEGTHPGGVHFELTGKDVTECVGGAQQITEEDLGSRYHTYCDPRLNASQSLELAFLMAEGMRRRQGIEPMFSDVFTGSSGVPARGDLNTGFGS